jgi:hypothetical protein
VPGINGNRPEFPLGFDGVVIDIDPDRQREEQALRNDFPEIFR